MRETQHVVIGGGLVGMAVAWGLARRGAAVTVLDEGDDAYRASRGNFGLVWVQSKGAGMPDYARWTRLSARLWPGFAARLAAETGVALELSQGGGFHLYLSEDEAAAGAAQLARIAEALGGDYPYEVLGHNAVKARLPAIGRDVVGGTFHPEDGHVNPLYLLRALHAAFAAAGGAYVPGCPVERIETRAGRFHVAGGAGAWTADRVTLAAGLGNARLAPMVGLSAPVRPNRGQVLITEKLAPFLPLPTVHVRQTGEGAVQIGDSKEDVGFDDRTDTGVVGRIARRAARTFPVLAGVRVVRSWGALRVMSPDGHPIYDRSASHPGASLVTCHSGVTLAAVHAEVLAGWLLGEDAPPFMEVFSAERFPSQAA